MRKMSFGTRVLSGQAVVTLFVLLAGGFAFYVASNLNGLIGNIVTRDMKKVSLASDVQSHVGAAIGSQRGMMLAALIGNEAGINSTQREVTDHLGLIEQSLHEVTPLSDSDKERQLVSEMNDARGEWAKAFERQRQMLADKRFDEATKMQTEVFTSLSDRLTGSSTQLLKIQTQITDFTRQEADNVAARAKGLSIALLLAAILAALGAFYTVHQGNTSLPPIFGGDYQERGPSLLRGTAGDLGQPGVGSRLIRTGGHTGGDFGICGRD